ncbi:MAG: hypothetical protein ACK4PK_02795 [Alphaproteobacteria bacterium]
MKKIKDAIISTLDKLDQGVSWIVGATLPVKVQEFCADKRVLICGIGVAAAVGSFFVVGPLTTFNIIAASFSVNMLAAYCEDNVQKRKNDSTGSPSNARVLPDAVQRAGSKIKSLSIDFSPASENSAPETSAKNNPGAGQPNRPTQRTPRT